MKLRVAFEILIQLALMVLMLAISGDIVRSLWNDRAWVSGGRIDLTLLPIGFAVGFTLGAQIGRWKLHALRQVVPQVDGLLFLTKAGVLTRVPEGRQARKLEEMSWLAVVAGIMLLNLFRWRQVPMVLIGTYACYLLGIYLAGTSLPFARLWFELRKVPPMEVEVAAPAETRETPSGELEIPPGRTIKLIWAFNPILQMIWGALVTVVIGGVALAEISSDPLGLDPYFSALALALGLGAGYSIGVKRLRVLHQVLLPLNNRFVLAQWDVMLSTPEGAIVMQLQGLAWALALIGWFGLPALSHGRIYLPGAFLSFGLGAFLAGKIWPFVRLWLELKRG